MSETVNPEVASVLVENHRRFLRFLEKRVGSAEDAADILQSAFVRCVERGDSLRDGERAQAWFYRLLRNAIVDHHRKRGAEGRALERKRGEVAAGTPSQTELEGAICSCMNDLVPTLKNEYADILTAVELREEPLSSYAERTQTTANNARVRLHRARRALKSRLEEACGTCATHGCLDCTCKPAQKMPDSSNCNAPTARPSAGSEDHHDD